MALNIVYRLTGVGWAECTIADADGTCTVSASYLSDALHNLVLAAGALLSRFSSMTFSFDEEPGEYRWVISSPRLNEIEVQILSLDELWGDKPNSLSTLSQRHSLSNCHECSHGCNNDA